MVVGLWGGAANAGILIDEPPPAPDEGSVSLPPLPQEENLLPFQVGPTSARNKFFVDRASVILTDAGVLRYTVVIRTPGGAENISYEGMNCTRREVRSYAYASKGGAWLRARNDAWESIGGTAYNGYRAVLASDGFCVESAPVSSAAEAVRKLEDQRYVLDPVFSD